MEESFLYDDLNRLTTITMNGVNTGHMSYDTLDPMTDKRTDGHDVFLTARHDYVNPEGQLRPPCCMQRDDGRFCYGDKDRRDGRGSIHPNQKGESKNEEYHKKYHPFSSSDGFGRPAAGGMTRRKPKGTFSASSKRK